MTTPENIISCLTPVVGLSKTVCPCSDTDRPGTAADSLSGYYATDQMNGIPINFLGAATDCTTGGIWDMLADTRDEAVRQFVADLSVEFAKNYAPIYPAFKGEIGKKEVGTGLTTAKSKAVLQIQSKKKPATMKLLGINIYSTVAGSFTLSLHSESNTATAVATKTQAIVTGWNNVRFTTPQLIDLYDQSVEYGTRYFLSWNIAEVGYIRSNRVGCNCGGYDNTFSNFVTVTGFSANDVSDVTDDIAINHGGVALGATIEANISCGLGNFLCGLDFDTFDASAMDWIIAQTLQHGNTMHLSQAFIQSQRVNQYTLYSAEVIYQKREHAQREYLNGLRFIAENMPEEALQCFKCRNERFKIQTILV